MSTPDMLLQRDTSTWHEDPGAMGVELGEVRLKMVFLCIDLQCIAKRLSYPVLSCPVLFCFLLFCFLLG
jgi:hypothetical protein